MKAIYKDTLYAVADDLGHGIILEDADGQRFYVSYSSPHLVIDPTDDEVLNSKASLSQRKDTK